MPLSHGGCADAGGGLRDILRHGGGCQKPAMLASVTSAGEARLVVSDGADIVDAKDPRRGALGALDRAVVADIVRSVAGRRPVSATVGDHPATPEALVPAARSMAATGVDIVKVGLMETGDGGGTGETGAPRRAITALGEARATGGLGRAGLVAVLFADRAPDLGVITELARAGFVGVMLDTSDKTSGSLTDVCDGAACAAFVRTARAEGLLAGLAGSLRSVHIRPLMGVFPDILGFRGALCGPAGRGGPIATAAVTAIRGTIDRVAADLAAQRVEAGSAAQ
ncbi:MAG: (5-formylfuran-3-yl)methyl phosphate synthase [Hyphomicrobiaceae bacterium]|nr:(5-formylfuran-3-yl)methyl phosphate synthase [Hyphomicrobiaceae bacterium]